MLHQSPAEPPGRVSEMRVMRLIIIIVIILKLNSTLVCTDLVTFRIKEKVGPVWISLHVLELKKLPQAQDEDLLTNLTKKLKGN